MAHYGGFRICKARQKSQSKIEYHKISVTGKQIMKVFARGDFVFLHLHGRQVIHVEHHRESICKLMVRSHGASKRIAEMDRASLGSLTLANPRLCMVHTATRIHVRSLRFDAPGAHSLC